MNASIPQITHKLRIKRKAIGTQANVALKLNLYGLRARDIGVIENGYPFLCTHKILVLCSFLKMPQRDTMALLSWRKQREIAVQKKHPRKNRRQCMCKERKYE
jgi:hypothetical protein